MPVHIGVLLAAEYGTTMAAIVRAHDRMTLIAGETTATLIASMAPRLCH
ncbi:hypothetical protein [Devosia nitrariae]|nr:hypothetical protein [Devosia nitrariae]